MQGLEQSIKALNLHTENRFRILEEQKENNSKITKMIERGDILELNKDYKNLIIDFKEISTW